MKIICPNQPCSEHGQLQQVTQDYVQSDFEQVQGWWLHSSSWQPAPVFSHLHSKKVSSKYSSHVSYFAPCPFPEYHWSKSASIFFIPHHFSIRYLYTLTRSFTSLLLSNLTAPSLSGFPCMLQSLHHCSSWLHCYIHILYWGTRAWTQHSKRDHTRAEQSRRITSLTCYSSGGCWLSLLWGHITGLQSTCCPAGHPGLFLQSYFPTDQYPAHLSALGYSSASAGFCPSLCWKDPISPFPQAVKVPVNGSTAVWCISHSFQFCIMRRASSGTKEI